MGVGTQARSATLWAVAHGVPRVVFMQQQRKGNPFALIARDPDIRADPTAVWEQVRAQGDLVRGDYGWFTATMSVGSRVLRGEEFGVPLPPESRITAALDSLRDPWAIGPIEPPSLLALDPPDHTRLRKLVSRAFTARRVAAMEPQIEATAHRLLDDLAGPGRSDLIDLVPTFASQLPVAVIADLLGVPESDRAPLLDWGNSAAVLLDAGISYGEFRGADRALREMHHWIQGHIEHLRREPGDDLLSAVIAQADAQPEDERPTDVELRVLGLLVLGAGFETTVNLIGNAVHLLSLHPEQRERLTADPALWGNAVEEVLRYDSPVQFNARMAHREVELGGHLVRPGRMVLTMLGGMHRDPAVWTDPHVFDVGRPNAGDHLAFSAGAHYCLGAGLARSEARIGLQALYERFPMLTTTAGAVRRPTRVLRGWSSLPVRLR